MIIKVEEMAVRKKETRETETIVEGSETGRKRDGNRKGAMKTKRRTDEG